MRVRSWIGTAFVLLAGPAYAADGPTLKAPATVEVDPGKLFLVKAETSAKWVGWYEPDGGVERFDLSALFDAPPKIGVYLGTAPAMPGTYRLFVFAGNDAGAATAITKVIVRGTPPPPVPPVPPPPPVPPGPGPNPPPAPGVVKRFVVVEDSLKAGQWRGDILGSPAVAAFYKSQGLSHRLIDVNAGDGADAVAKAWIARAAGKQLPYLWTMDAAGAQLSEGECPTTPDGVISALGGPPHKRAMGNNPPNVKRFAWKKFGDTPNTPIIPRAQWKPVNLDTFLPPVHDQDGRGQCNASATCTALEACRAQAGLPYVYLSAGDLYSQINGGRDDGSTLEDGLAAALETGPATVATVPYVWDGRNHGGDAAVKAERALYRAVECYQCPNFDAMASALQQGFFIVEGLSWADGDNPDRDGWIPAAMRGSVGGHALCGYGLVQRNGVWGIRTRNSWSASWGVAGNCVIPEKRFESEIGGFWAVRAVVQTPTDFPAPKLSFRDDPFGLRAYERMAATPARPRATVDPLDCRELAFLKP